MKPTLEEMTETTTEACINLKHAGIVILGEEIRTEEDLEEGLERLKAFYKRPGGMSRGY